MSAINRQTSPFGDVVVQPLGEAVFGQGSSVTVAVKHDRYSWLAPEVIWSNLLGDFRIEFHCYTPADGIRRFVPVVGLEAFVDEAFLAGVAILVEEEGLSPHDRNLLFARHHLFQRARRMPEHLTRRFDASRDLYVRTGGRGGHINHSLLPESVSFDSESVSPIAIRELTRQGRELARDAGIRKPTNRVAIHFGLAEAAKRHPLRVCESAVSGVVRAALFEESSMGVAPDARLLSLVNDRILAWMESHLHLPREEFDRAFFPGKGNFVKAIANQPASPGGVLPYNDVRACIIYLGWQAYLDVSLSLARFMSRFLESLPDCLNDAERRIFEEMYFPQPHFGNLPLALLIERGGFMKNVVTALWENPGDHLLIGALHRLLDIYGQMAVNRREADRRFKQRADERRRIVQELTGQDWLLETRTHTDPSNRIFDAIGEHLAGEMRLRCDWCGGGWSARLARPDDLAERWQEIELEIGCECGRVAEETALSVEAFRRLASAFI